MDWEINIHVMYIECEYRGATKHALRGHWLSKHEGIRFHCEECEYLATSKYLLKQHHELIIWVSDINAMNVNYLPEQSST